ncbi:MAG: hypothetical protein A2Z21_00510 [Candidatus Fraserbacteria bacterium RBG_16_55_9]|uniref:Stress response protein n=1 Tax=Fraserbacteria sp. (strain RBG_16_55_9) TaxID=1817864 RepID=A0A1F5UXE2_FRAXR|nr:MAG: hypothetical protein A2Z21_00510 [Candidatus Fraserbacteria bacterium RBG_16_55_9]
MPKRIRKDLERYKRIVRGEIRKNLKDLIESGEIVGQRGKDIVKIPIKSIRIPEFRYDPRNAGGIGSGDGELGQPVRVGENRDPWGQPGQGGGAHFPEVEIELWELAEILGEELELPRIQPKGERRFLQGGEDYTDVSVIGPETLLMKRRAYREGLKRQFLLNESGKGALPGIGKIPAALCPPLIVTPIKEDKRYLHSEPEPEPQTNAVIVFMRDASGSMSGEKTEIIRQENYWIDIWLRTHYDNVERVYLLHDYEAQEVDEKEFYELSTGGGTRISSAYELCAKIIERRYSPDQWNIYPFHFSDGENWIGDTENFCVPLLRNALLPCCNIFCYGQVTLGRRSPGLHLVKLEEHLGQDGRWMSSIIAGREDILRSIKDFLGKGR